TRVNDPITGEPRDWSGFFPRWQWDADIRRDAGKFAYGFTLNDYRRTTAFRTDEFDINRNQGFPYTSAFIEYRATATRKLTLNAENLSDSAGTRDLIVFDPDRRSPEPAFTEHRYRNSHVRLSLTF